MRALGEEGGAYAAWDWLLCEPAPAGNVRFPPVGSGSWYFSQCKS